MGTIDWNEKLILNQCGPCSRRRDATLCCAARGELLTAQLSGRLWRPGPSSALGGGCVCSLRVREALVGCSYCNNPGATPTPGQTLFQIPEAGCKDQRPVEGESHFSVMRQPGVANRKARPEFSLRLPGPLTDMSVLQAWAAGAPQPESYALEGSISLPVSKSRAVDRGRYRRVFSPCVVEYSSWGIIEISQMCYPTTDRQN